MSDHLLQLQCAAVYGDEALTDFFLNDQNSLTYMAAVRFDDELLAVVQCQKIIKALDLIAVGDDQVCKRHGDTRG